MVLLKTKRLGFLRFVVHAAGLSFEEQVDGHSQEKIGTPQASHLQGAYSGKNPMFCVGEALYRDNLSGS